MAKELPWYRSIRTRTLFAFFLTLLLPFYFLLRIGLDSYFQKKDLLERNLFSQQTEMILKINEFYLEYLENLRQTGIEFTKEKSLNRLPGHDSPNLWRNEEYRFFKTTQDEPRMRSKHKVAYLSHFSAFKRMVIQKIYRDPSEYNPVSCPLKVQVYTLEKSIFDPNYKGTHRYRPGAAFLEEPLTYRNLFPDSTPPETKDFKKVVEFLKQYPFRSYFLQLPTHPTLHPNDDLVEVLWDGLGQVVKPIIRGIMFGENLAWNYGLEEYTSGLHTNLLNNRARYLPLQFMNFDFDFYWNTLPLEFDPKLYLENQQPAPKAYVVLLVDKVRARSMFFENFILNKFPSGMERLSQEVFDFKQELATGNMGLIAYTPGKSLNSQVKFHFSLGAKPTDQFLKRKVEALYSLQSGKLISNQELISFLHTNLNLARVKNADFATLTSLSKTWQKPLRLFLNEENSLDTMATIFSPAGLDGVFFYLFQPNASIENQLSRNTKFYALFSLIALCICIFLALNLISSILNPVQSMSSVLDRMAEGNYDHRVDLSSEDELGRLASSLNSTALKLETRLKGMESISNLYKELNEGRKIETLLEDLLKDLVEFTSAKGGLLGLFDRRWPADVSLYRKTGDCPEPLYIQDWIKIASEEVKLVEYEGNSCLTWKIEHRASNHKRLFGLVILFRIHESCPLELVQVFFKQVKTLLVKNYMNQLQQDVYAGELLQRSLLPEKIPDLPDSLKLGTLYQPSRGLSGDFYDLISNSNGLHIIIADVAGKGIGPALFGACARSYLSILIHKGLRPAEVLQSLNSLLCTRRFDQQFLTMFYAFLPDGESQLSYASAGQNQMLMKRRDGRIDELSAPGLPLGIMEDSAYEELRLDFHEGDSLLLFTDGVTEIESPEREVFGLEALKTVLGRFDSGSPEEFCETLSNLLEDHSQGGIPADDLTLLHLHFLESDHE